GPRRTRSRDRPDGLGSATTAAAATTATTTTTVTTAIAAVATGGALGAGAEVAELLADLGVEGVLEGHVLPVATGLGRARVVATGAVARHERRDRRQRHLAVRVDVVDLDLDGLTELEDVLDLVDALATAHLGDV